MGNPSEISLVHTASISQGPSSSLIFGSISKRKLFRSKARVCKRVMPASLPPKENKQDWRAADDKEQCSPFPDVVS